MGAGSAKCPARRSAARRLTMGIVSIAFKSRYPPIRSGKAERAVIVVWCSVTDEPAARAS